MKAILLAAGKSSRMWPLAQKKNKCMLEFLGKPLISYQIETIEKFHKDIYLVAHSQEQVQTYKIKIEIGNIKNFFLDDVDLISNEELRTPMIGIYTAFKELDKLGYERAFILSCDAPLIKYDVIDLLIKQSEGFNLCIPRWNNGFLEPLFAIYPVKKSLQTSKESIQTQKYKLTEILDKTWKINYISVEDEIKPIDDNLISFVNINGPIDVEKLMKIYKKNRIHNNNNR